MILAIIVAFIWGVVISLKVIELDGMIIAHYKN